MSSPYTGFIGSLLVETMSYDMTIQHKTLAAGRWYELRLREQLGNVGSEINRAIIWKERDEKKYHNSLDRACELMDLTLQDPRWQDERLRELRRVREMITDAISGGKEYGSTLEDMDSYFFAFAFAARLEHEHTSYPIG